METLKPIEGQINWNADHMPTPLNYARYVDSVERVAESIEFDGVRYERVRECRDASLDRSTQFYCSECECTVDVPLLWGVVDYCPGCGAKVVSE